MFLQVNESTAHILGTTLGKRIQIDIADIPLTDTVIRQLGQFDIPAGNLKTHQLTRRRTHHFQQETRAWFSTQVFTDKGHRLIRHHRIVNTQDHIALLQSDFRCGHIGIGLVDDDTIQFLVLTDQRTDTGILTREHQPQILCLVLGVIFRIGIQTPQHGIDTRANRSLGIERIHIEQFQVLIYLVEDVEMLAHLKVMVTVLLCLRR